MRTHWAGCGLAIALAAVLTLGGTPAAAQAGGDWPPGQPVPGPVLPCLSFAPPPTAVLGDLPGAMRATDWLRIEGDQSTGYIVHQELRVERGSDLWFAAYWEGPPGPSHWVEIMPGVAGVYHLTLTVTDCLGRSDSVTHDVLAIQFTPVP